MSTLTLTGLLALLHDKGCRKFFLKRLAENDNSKNGVYLGSSFKALNVLPHKEIVPTRYKQNPIFKATLDYGWLSEDGEIWDAPNAKLILYPQYPEVRLSGFLKGCKRAPSKLMSTRDAGRLLVFGVRGDGKIIGHVADRNSKALNEFGSLGEIPMDGVFYGIELIGKRIVGDRRSVLLAKLQDIHNKRWIMSKRLFASGKVGPCNSSNCGGYTLEAEFGIIPNGYSDPDFLGWEIKQHGVQHFDRFETGAITLFTPEPTGGFYREKGVFAFLKTFGYPDKRGRPDRLNFGGIHRVGEYHKSTGLGLSISGYDPGSGKITDETGGIILCSPNGNIAASWSFSGLLKHWNRKHARAVYVPSILRLDPCRRYFYGNIIRLGIGTDFFLFLKAMSEGKIYYDPGIKAENISGTPKVKRRSQFRIHSKNIPSLYENTEKVNLENSH